MAKTIIEGVSRRIPSAGPASGGGVRPASGFAWGLAAALLVLPVPSSPALAQSALERNLPAAAAPGPASITVGEADYGQGDDTPLGVDVAGVRLIGQEEAVPAHAQRGIGIGSVPGVDAAAATAALSPYIGQPLTRALIVRMQRELAGLWRRQGFPFVSVTVPPQEITAGVLTLRVVEFHAGKVSVEGAAVERNLAGRIRLAPGDRIDAAALEEDLDWLNRNPYRHVAGSFAPGDAAGASDFTLKVTEDRPWSVFAGYANTGSEATGRDRWTLGAGAWIPELDDLTVSYRFTRSGAFRHGGDLVSLDVSRPGYLSHAARFELPTGPRQALSIAPNFVETNELVEGTPFSFDNWTFELPILYRSAVSNILPGHYWGDVYFGVEPKWVKRTTAFSGVDVASGKAGLFNLVIGWSGDFSDAYGSTAVDARIKLNPGGVVGGNTSADWAAFTGGRVTDATYVTGGFDITRTTDLTHGFFWVSQFTGLVAGQALPDTERLGLGGFYAVRGYDTDDGSVDTGLVWRNELRLPTFSPLANSGTGLSDSASPFAFVDLGHGYDFAARDHATLASTGIGLDYAIGRNLSASLTGAAALNDAGRTESGDWTLNASLRISY
jgi:hemolysin activation/secretion protein